MNTSFPPGEYWMYLRKSRADVEAEARGEGETLTKHRKALYRFSKENNLTVTRVYPEVESGESIFHRPEMVKLLRDMEDSPPAGVLVMDIDRLGRGDKIDQGIIEKTFKESNTLIVTPTETYDMNNENGEFSVEVKTFLARLELKQTTKRLQGGRIRSIENDRNYLGTRPPYGYSIQKDKDGRTLIPNPTQADVVRQIFEWYTHTDPNKRMGSDKIANELNQMQIPTYTQKSPWVSSTVLNILKNAVYCGRLQWKKKENKKSKEIGKRRDVRTRPKEEWIDVEGKHEPLITPEVYKRAQDILAGKYHVPYQLVNGITNPLAGLVRCGKCGASMVYRPYVSQPGHLKCYNKHCDNKSSRFEYVERKIVVALNDWVEKYKAQWEAHKPDKGNDNASANLKINVEKTLITELRELEGQKQKIFDLFERDFYDEDTFLKRSDEIIKRIIDTKQALNKITKEIEYSEKRSEMQKDIIPKAEKVISMYSHAKTAAEKNNLLKSILDHAVYEKEKSQWNDEFTLTLFPRLPK